MSNTTEDQEKAEYSEKLTRSLKQAIDDVKSRNADREDVVVELRESEATRLELLAEELRPLINEIDDADERFDFGLTRGEKPRLWIDMTSFVSMGQSKRAYRFIKDTRMGRLVLAETEEMDKMADVVSEYVAEKVLEREKEIEGEWVSLKQAETTGQQISDAKTDQTNKKPVKPASKWRSFFWFLFGIIFTLAAIAASAFFLIPDAF